jgi:hypothetical protein
VFKGLIMSRKVAFLRLYFFLWLVAGCFILSSETVKVSEAPWSQSHIQHVALKNDLRDQLREFSASQDIGLDLVGALEGGFSGSMICRHRLDGCSMNWPSHAPAVWTISGSSET